MEYGIVLRDTIDRKVINEYMVISSGVGSTEQDLLTLKDDLA